ncbi:MAG: PP2C family protein-serine/threonine phosphatase [Spirochaetota bacterium]
MVYHIRQIYSSARYYSRFSINFGLLYIAIIHYYISASPAVITVVAASLFYQVLRMLLEMSRLTRRKTVSHLLLFTIAVLTALLLCAPVTYPFRTSVTVYLAVILVTVSLFSLFVIRRNLGNRYRNQTTYLVLFAGIIGILMPISLVGIMIHTDFPIPFSLVSLITIITPLLIGRNFLEQSQFNDLISRKIYSLQFSLDLISGILAAFLLTALFQIPHPSKMFALHAIFTAVLAILVFRFLILSRIRNRIITGRDRYTESLQSIIENTVTTLSLGDRIARIKSEIFSLLQINFVRFGIFEEKTRSILAADYPDVLYIAPSSPLARYYDKRGDIIKRDLLLNRSLDDCLTSFDDSDSIYLAVPVYLHGRVSGILFAGEKRNRFPFFKDDINYLSTAGTLVMQMIENEALFNQSVIRGKYERELDNASYVQMRLFPATIPPDRGIDTSIYYRPYNKVTGDFIDIIPVDEHRTAIFIGDITGHGLPAAMVHSTTAALVRSLLHEGYDLQKILLTLNTFLTSRYRGHELLTLFGCMFDKRDRSLEYINAGHPMPYVISPVEGKISPIESRGHILGVMETPFYCTSTITLTQGCQILFYTDGIVEIQKSQSDMNIGSTFLEETLRDIVDASIEEKMEQLVLYIDKNDQKNINDDITFAFVEIE